MLRLSTNKLLNPPQTLSIGTENMMILGNFTDEKISPDQPVINSNTDNIPYCPVQLMSVVDNKKYFVTHIKQTIIELPEYFVLLETLAAMTELDEIDIIIDSPGGLISTGSAIASMIEDCKGKVRTIAVGICASAGSLIWSAGHECYVTETAVLMYHMSAHGAGGNSKLIEIEAKAMIEYVKNACLKVAVSKGHLLQEEADRIYEDPNYEIYLPYTTIIERLNKGE